MNAPIFFMLAPLLLAIPVYYFFSTRTRGTILFSIFFCLFCGVLSILITLDKPLVLLGFSIPVGHSFSAFGRDFIFLPAMRPVLSLMYFSVAGFFLGGLIIRLDTVFLPVGFLSLSFFAAALFVQPFLYASFFLFFSACLYSVLLYSGSSSQSRASTRLLVFSLLSIPFLLLAGSFLSVSAGESPENSSLATGFILLAVGFILLLTLPPMHVWQLDAADNSNAFSFFFIMAFHTSSILFLLLRFFNEFEWLRLSPLPFQAFQGLGIFLCIVGFVFALIQKRLGRLIVYLSMIQLGCLFIALSTRSSEGLSIVFVLLALRVFLLFLCGLSAYQIRSVYADDRFDTIRGAFVRLPFSVICIFLVLLSVTGFPLFLSFPSYWATLRLISFQLDFVDITLLVLLLSMTIGSLSVFNAIRIILLRKVDQTEELSESRLFQFFIVVSLLCLVVFSVFPQFYFPIISNATTAFSNLWK
jgi:formate hydrogenlyase subunit 3/multisubunit Na+/H+ antiporter MnhD subunit